MNFYLWTDEIIAQVWPSMMCRRRILNMCLKTPPRKARAIPPAGRAYGDILKMGVT